MSSAHFKVVFTIGAVTAFLVIVWSLVFFGYSVKRANEYHDVYTNMLDNKCVKGVGFNKAAAEFLKVVERLRGGMLA